MTTNPCLLAMQGEASKRDASEELELCRSSLRQWSSSSLVAAAEHPEQLLAGAEAVLLAFTDGRAGVCSPAAAVLDKLKADLMEVAGVGVLMAASSSQANFSSQARALAARLVE